MTKRSIMLAAVLLAAGAAMLQAKSDKRGVSENEFQFKAQLAALEPGVSWYYNWANVAGRYLTNEPMEYLPMCWNSHYTADDIREYVKSHPATKYMLGFNEPNFTNQANMTPAEAAAAWPAVRALAQELGLKLVAPALNYSPNPPYQDPLKWMDEFVALVGTDAFDYTAVHAYGGLGVIQQIAGDFHDRYGKDVWLTEFCYWPEEGNPNSSVAPETQIAFMQSAVEWLEKTPWIYRYAWFKPIGDSDVTPGPNFGLLISGKAENPRELSEQGKVYVNMVTFDPDHYLAINTLAPASDYWTQQAALLGSAVDAANDWSPLEIVKFVGASVDYRFDVPAAGTYNLVLRLGGYGEPTRFDPFVTVYSVADDGTTAELAPKQKLTLPNSDTDFIEVAIPVELQAGKQTIRLADADAYSPSGMRLSAVKLADADGMDAVEAVAADTASASVDVYNLQGVAVRRGADAADPLSGLPAGIYVAGGRKVAKR